MRGRVHSIETFSTLDGPGIRMVVFLQGCHLRCRYCHNPDTWSYSLASTSYYSSEELMALVRRGLGYYRNSGGGLTFSGGEPLLQHCFVCEVFERCHQEGIHTALDTALYVPPSRVQAVLPFTDLFIADIKHIDSAKSRWLTGQSNDLNLANIRSINAAGTQLWIRYVVVPGYTDAERDITALAEFLAPLSEVKRIELLAYHTLGVHKWELLGLDYDLHAVEPPQADEMQRLQEIVQQITGKPVYVS
ncbi:MAG: pyruvate formate lyase-activating protein [Syntrophomonadaceae bacterium]|jgi:pyruvate formate lyase activating enzyme|nr:pyruvate formate lyase-activating protein [Syntrophomonadaceae bacterium]